jgi:hypothetical protein
MPASHGVKKAKPFGPFFSASACGDRIFQGRAMWQFMGRAFAFDGIAPGLFQRKAGTPPIDDSGGVPKQTCRRI